MLRTFGRCHLLIVGILGVQVNKLVRAFCYFLLILGAAYYNYTNRLPLHTQVLLCRSKLSITCRPVKACPHQATKFPKTATNVARNGNKLLPFLATICCRFWQQFVAVFGNKVAWCGQAIKR